MDLARQKELAGGQDRNLLHRETSNGACLSAIPPLLNGTEFSSEEFQDNLCLRHELMPQDIPATCDSCGKRLLIDHALSFPNGGLVLARHNDTAKEWSTLGGRSLIPSSISYEPKIVSRKVQGERTGSGARQEIATSEGGAVLVG